MSGGGPLLAPDRAEPPPSTMNRGSTAVDRDHVLRRVGLRVPDPLFATTIAAGHQSAPHRLLLAASPTPTL
jgi:hypothetical protein